MKGRGWQYYSDEEKEKHKAKCVVKLTKLLKEKEKEIKRIEETDEYFTIFWRGGGMFTCRGTIKSLIALPKTQFALEDLF